MIKSMLFTIFTLSYRNLMKRASIKIYKPEDE